MAGTGAVRHGFAQSDAVRIRRVREYELPRASLRLFADSLEEDGLIPLCAPARGRITIPSFSVYWLLAVCENAEADFDGEFVREMLPKAGENAGNFPRAKLRGGAFRSFASPAIGIFTNGARGWTAATLTVRRIFPRKRTAF